MVLEWGCKDYIRNSASESLFGLDAVVRGRLLSVEMRQKSCCISEDPSRRWPNKTILVDAHIAL